MKKMLTVFMALALWTCVAQALELRDGLKVDELIAAKDLYTLQKVSSSVLVLDARTQRSFREERIAGARLPRDAAYYRQEELFRTGALKKLERAKESLAEGMKRIPREMPVVTYCGTGCGASSVLFYELERLGFTDVRVLDEGFDYWVEAGYPLERG
jgi:3-mercaptopyruvate sulfurtransferase SseA